MPGRARPQRCPLTPRPRRGPARASWMAAAARGIPLAAIITAVAVVALTYLAGKLLYRLRDVILLMVVGGSSP